MDKSGKRAAPAARTTASDWARRAAVIALSSYGLMYFSAKYYIPTMGGDDFFKYYPMYLRPLNLAATEAPYVFRQISAVLTFLFYKGGIYYPGVVAFHDPSIDPRVFFAALFSNYLCLAAAAWLTGQVVEAMAGVRGGVYPLLAGLFCLLSFQAQSAVITGLTEGVSWLLFAACLLALVKRNAVALGLLLALSVFQRETISIAIGCIAFVLLVADPAQRGFHLRAWLWALACFGAYMALRLFSGVAGHGEQTSVQAIVRALTSLRLTRGFILQSLLSQSALLLALAAGAAARVERRTPWLLGFLVAFAALYAVGLATGIGNNIGRICSILTPGFAALAACAMMQRGQTVGGGEARRSARKPAAF